MTDLQNALSDLVTKKVNKGETIEQAVMDFYKPSNIQFAKDVVEAITKLKGNYKGGMSHYCNKVIDFPVKNLNVIIHSYSLPLISLDSVYVINIENLKNRPNELE
jgi:hypothetical protein